MIRHLRTAATKILASFLALSAIAAFGDKPMEFLYDTREAASLKPYTYKADGPYLLHLFSVPQDNAVGTNDLNNVITLFTFQKDRLQSKEYFRNTIGSLSGGGQYLPEPLSDHSIGFAQTRRFIIFDFNTKKAEEHTITTSIDRNILHVGIANIDKKQYFFEIESDNPKSEDYNDITRTLWLMDLNSKPPHLIKKMEKAKGSVWSIFKDQLFFCDFKNIELKVYNSNLGPSHHPVMDVLNKNKGNVDFVDVIPHPSLPFAVLSGGENGAMYICWNQVFRDERPQNLFKNNETLKYSFSPDGRWLVFQKTDPEPERSFIMPVSEKYPYYLGSPILLEGATFDRDNFAWTNNPVCLVGSFGNKLYRYDLTKEGHPEAAGYPSYWDYVVDQDLEKLRKAGKQGLKPKP